MLEEREQKSVYPLKYANVNSYCVSLCVPMCAVHLIACIIKR